MEVTYLLVFVGGVFVGVVVALMLCATSRKFETLLELDPPVFVGDPTCDAAGVHIDGTAPSSGPNQQFLGLHSKVYNTDPGIPDFPDPDDTTAQGTTFPITVDVGPTRPAHGWIVVWAVYKASSVGVPYEYDCPEGQPPPPPPS
jgi:hypothetical protein